jgi:hypothetical protein
MAGGPHRSRVRSVLLGVAVVGSTRVDTDRLRSQTPSSGGRRPTEGWLVTFSTRLEVPRQRRAGVLRPFER